MLRDEIDFDDTESEESEEFDDDFDDEFEDDSWDEEEEWEEDEDLEEYGDDPTGLSSRVPSTQFASTRRRLSRLPTRSFRGP